MKSILSVAEFLPLSYSKLFSHLKKDISDLLSGQIVDSATKQNKSHLDDKVDTLIANFYPELRGSFNIRSKFLMQKALRGSWIIFFPKSLRKFRSKRLFRALIDALWVSRNLTCSGFGERKLNHFISELCFEVGGKNLHIDNTLKDAIFYSQTQIKLEDVLCCESTYSAPAAYTSFDYMKSDFKTYTGAGLYAFGHSLVTYEMLSLSLFHLDKNQFHDIYIGPSFVANSALALMVALKAQEYHQNTNCIISDEKLIASTCQNLESLPSLDDPNILDRLKIDLWTNRRPTFFDALKYDYEIWKWLENKLSSALYQYKRPYVCLYLRDSGFKSEGNSLHLNSDRNVDPLSYLPIIDELIRLGYDVIRLGDPHQQPISSNSSSYFEYSHSKVKNDLNDMYLIANAEFMVVGGAGGGAHAGDIFCKPTLFVDFPAIRRGNFSPLGVHIPLVYQNNQLPISLSSTLELTPNGCQDAVAMH